MSKQPWKLVDLTGGTQRGLASREFAAPPRAGEYVEIEESGKAALYRVIAIVHAGSAALPGDVLLVREGECVAVRLRLAASCAPHQPPAAS